MFFINSPVRTLIIILIFSLLSCKNEEKFRDEELICLTPDEYQKLILTSPPNIELELPSPKPVTKTSDNAIKISVTSDNSYYLEDKVIDVENIEAEIISKVIATGDSIIELRGDQASSWEANVKIIDIAKENHLKIVIKTKVK